MKVNVRLQLISTLTLNFHRKSFFAYKIVKNCRRKVDNLLYECLEMCFSVLCKITVLFSQLNKHPLFGKWFYLHLKYPCLMEFSSFLIFYLQNSANKTRESIKAQSLIIYSYKEAPSSDGNRSINLVVGSQTHLSLYLIPTCRVVEENYLQRPGTESFGISE